MMAKSVSYHDSEVFNVTTKVFPISWAQPDPAIIRQAAEVLQEGGLVAFPTETVYGLGADALNPDAVRRIFKAKGRPSDNPLIVHLGRKAKIGDYAEDIPAMAEKLAEKFWPGPLTLVLKKSLLVSDEITAGLETVALRVPNHPVALALLEEFGEGIVAPSANKSGFPSPTRAEDVETDLRGMVEMILDAGPTEIGVESTVLDVTQSPPVILRWGGLTKEEIEAVIGPISTLADPELLKRSPGTRHRHYAPHAKLVLIRPGDEQEFAGRMKQLRQRGLTVGCIVHSFQLAQHERGKLMRVLPPSLTGVAKYLFRTMRELDAEGVDVIVVEGVEEEGLGRAIMDRLQRASNSND
ncbi:MAG TPA: L-threonylcarbamoyladenylate synthase [Bacteroidota bacterium]|nr:L-threonylcarbamoyladenylate synthase [Bacteroidota bacterium]